MNFSIIIPNFNGINFLPHCLNSILEAIKQTPKNKYEIILVDNGSTDNSINLAKQINSQIKIVKNKTNLGFAQAVNQGIFTSNYDFIVPCNNDIRLSTDWFRFITQTIESNPNVATFFGTVLNKDGTLIESQGLKFFLKGKCLNVNNGQRFLPSTIYHLPSKQIWGGNASLIVYNKEIIKKIGLFDPRFFAYEEDVDLALRLHQAGYKTLLISQAISFHLGGGTSRKMGYFRQMMDTKNWCLIILKNYSKKTFFLNFFPIIGERFRNLSYLIKAIIKTDRLKSIYTLPITLFKTYFEVIKFLIENCKLKIVN